MSWLPLSSLNACWKSAKLSSYLEKKSLGELDFIHDWRHKSWTDCDNNWYLCGAIHFLFVEGDSSLKEGHSQVLIFAYASVKPLPKSFTVNFPQRKWEKGHFSFLSWLAFYIKMAIGNLYLTFPKSLQVKNNATFILCPAYGGMWWKNRHTFSAASKSLLIRWREPMLK